MNTNAQDTPTNTPARDTLGFHRAMAVAVFGADSPAVAFLDAKIADSPGGAEEPVVMPEGQVVQLLATLHFGSTPAADQEGPDR